MSETSPSMKHPGKVAGWKTRLGILGELFAFLWAAKMWWLIPMIIALIVFAVLLALGASGSGGPLIYTLF